MEAAAVTLTISVAKCHCYATGQFKNALIE